MRPSPCVVAAALALCAASHASPAEPSAAAVEATRLLALATAGEPDVVEVQRAAAARAAPPRDATEGWSRRARLAALVPRVLAEYRHDDRSYRVEGLTGSGEVDYLRTMPGDTVQVRLDWALDGLVLGRAELQAHAAEAAAEARRRAAVDRATALFFERLRLRVALEAEAATRGRDRAEAELELARVTAQLHALTGLYRAAP